MGDACARSCRRRRSWRARWSWRGGWPTGPTKAYVEVRHAVRFGAVNALPDVLAAEGAAQARLAHTADHAGAVADFLAKRRPTFQGK